ncbi:hypothetical protein C8J56DRAFT_891507 [Mycena floridula]|nr:hypothetical protein C8J56DRAFT_891507 [Mycena floridula]
MPRFSCQLLFVLVASSIITKSHDRYNETPEAWRNSSSLNVGLYKGNRLHIFLTVSLPQSQQVSYLLGSSSLFTSPHRVTAQSIKASFEVVSRYPHEKTETIGIRVHFLQP